MIKADHFIPLKIMLPDRTGDFKDLARVFANTPYPFVFATTGFAVSLFWNSENDCNYYDECICYAEGGFGLCGDDLDFLYRGFDFGDDYFHFRDSGFYYSDGDIDCGAATFYFPDRNICYADIIRRILTIYITN